QIDQALRAGLTAVGALINSMALQRCRYQSPILQPNLVIENPDQPREQFRPGADHSSLSAIDRRLSPGKPQVRVARDLLKKKSTPHRLAPLARGLVASVLIAAIATIWMYVVRPHDLEPSNGSPVVAFLQTSAGAVADSLIGLLSGMR